MKKPRSLFAFAHIVAMCGDHDVSTNSDTEVWVSVDLTEDFPIHDIVGHCWFVPW